MASTALLVRRRISAPLFGVRHWNPEHDETPLRIPLSGAEASVFINTIHVRPAPLVILNCTIQVRILQPSAALTKGLGSRRAPAKAAALEIFPLFEQAFDALEALLMTAGGVRDLLPGSRPRLQTFFRDDGFGSREGVEWRFESDDEWQAFRPPSMARARRNPAFTAAQLITPQKWARMQRAAAAGSVPKGEVLDLLRIRAKATFDEKPLALIEATIVAEAITREFCVAVLERRGFSKNRLKSLRQDMTFNLLLNALLPLSLSKSELNRISDAVSAVDKLRKLRNDFVHENSQDEATDSDTIRQGLDGAVRLVEFLLERESRFRSAAV